MTVAESIPSQIFRAPVSTAKIASAIAAPLLEKVVQITCFTSDQKEVVVSLTVGEIFQRTIRAVREGGSHPYFQDVHITGSSIASLWSAIPCSDIDLHASVDLRGLNSAEQMREMHEMDWTFKQALFEAIQSTIPKSAMT
jgi:hypothetical protein